MDETAIRKRYPKDWKIHGKKRLKKVYKSLKAKGLIIDVKRSPTEWGLTPFGHKVAMKYGFCE